MKKDWFRDFKVMISNWSNKSRIKKNIMTKSNMIVLLLSFSCTVIAQSNLSDTISQPPSTTAPEEIENTIFALALVTFSYNLKQFKKI